MKPSLSYLLPVCVCIAVLSPSRASEEVEFVRAATKEWVAVEQTLSSEAAAWVEKQALLKDLTAASRVEIAKLQSALAEVAATRSATDSLRKELIAQQESLQDNRETILDFLIEMEPQLLTFKQRLPKPLRKKLESLYQRIPKDSYNATPGIGERMQTVVGILHGIHEFDRTVTVSDEIHTLADGAKSEVQTVYIGLGAAYYRTRSGKDAGKGYPESKGWVWESQPALSDKIAEVIAIVNQSTQEARFIDLPVAL